jgi:hypothetical protein
MAPGIVVEGDVVAVHGHWTDDRSRICSRVGADGLIPPDDFGADSAVPSGGRGCCDASELPAGCQPGPRRRDDAPADAAAPSGAHLAQIIVHTRWRLSVDERSHPESRRADS